MWIGHMPCATPLRAALSWRLQGRVYTNLTSQMVRRMATRSPPPHSTPDGAQNMSKEQAELLRLLRESEAMANKRADARTQEQSLGLAGVALSQGGTAVGSSRVDKWTGLGKKWGDLSGGQKAARVTVNTSRLFVITFGATLTFVIGYALFSELFAQNSPTVIYNEACKLIEKSDKVHAHLLEPYRFQTSLTDFRSDYSPLNPPSHPHRPSQTVHSTRYMDPRTGHEMMVLHFFVQSRDKDEPLGYWQYARSSIITGGCWLKMKAIEGGMFVYEWWKEQTSEEPIIRRPEAAPLEPTPPAPAEPWWITRKLRSFVHGVGTLVGQTSDAVGMSSLDFAGTKPVPGTWTDGEVHIELAKDDNGVFQYKHFSIDIPSSHSPLRRRVYLDRRHGDLPAR